MSDDPTIKGTARAAVNKKTYSAHKKTIINNLKSSKNSKSRKSMRGTEDSKPLESTRKAHQILDKELDFDATEKKRRLKAMRKELRGLNRIKGPIEIPIESILKYQHKYPQNDQ